VFLLISFSKSFAQQPAHFFLGKEEFEGVQIYDVIQDSELNYWFATDQGFYKYDGYNFVSIKCIDLKGQSAFGFVKNKNNTIFCYNLNNQIIKIENNECSIFYELKEQERSSDIYLHITSDNNLLILTKTALLFDENGKRIKTQTLRPNYYAYPFLTQQGKTISHIADEDSLLVFDNNTFNVVPLINAPDNLIGVLKFFRIHETTYAISIATKEFFTFDENNYQLKSIPENIFIDNKEYLRFYNENNQLWIAGTLSGVRFINEPSQPKPIDLMYSQFLISDVFKDSEGNMLLSTFNNGVLVVPNLEIPDVLTLPENQSIVSIHHDKDAGMLMGTLNGRLLTKKGNDYSVLCDNGRRPLQAIYSWPNFPFILFDDGQIKAYNKATGKIILLVTGSLKDATLVDDHTIYLALNTSICKITWKGLNIFEKEYVNNLKIRSYSIETESKNKNIYVGTSDGLKIVAPNGNIKDAKFNTQSIFANDLENNAETIYVAAKTNGILVFKDGKVIQQIIPKVNQKEIEVYKLIVKDKKIYTNSSEGFVVFDMNGSVLMQLNKMHGFSTNKIFDFEILDDQLWICHSKGIHKLSTELLKSKIEKPLIHLVDININDTVTPTLSQKGEFKSDQRKFRFIVSSSTLRNKENIRYHYKLLGYEDNWSIANYNDNEIIYNALAPGNYTFTVKAENQTVFSDPVFYTFSISAPFYTRTWFIIATALFFLLIITLIYRRQLNVQKKKAKMINELNFSRLTAIQSQMNPHFIFNSLNSIQDLVLKGDVDKSYSFITKFSNLIRRTLNYSDKDFIEFEQEIKLIELYLSLEKLRFKEDLDYKIDADSIEDIMVPPMLIQPFIENALIHGLLHKEGKKLISIRFELTDVLICTIEDNGIGREKAKEIKLRQRSDHESFSSQAIKKRFSILSEHFKGELGFKYEDLYFNNEATGTRVTLYVPVKRKF